MQTLSKEGCVVLEAYFEAEACATLLEEIRAYRRENPLPEIHRPMKGRSLRYKVIDGQVIREHFPSIWELYSRQVLELARAQSGEEIDLLPNPKVGVNVNIMEPQGSTYRWHYDRNAVTAILYLNQVQGGETELFPNYRILLKNPRLARLQQALDRIAHIPFIRALFVRRRVIAPQTGKLVLMAGNRCWHSVRPVHGEQERINIIFAYDQRNGQQAMNEGLDTYLYTQEQATQADPNYKK